MCVCVSCLFPFNNKTLKKSKTFCEHSICSSVLVEVMDQRGIMPPPPPPRSPPSTQPVSLTIKNKTKTKLLLHVSYRVRHNISILFQFNSRRVKATSHRVKALIQSELIQDNNNNNRYHNNHNGNRNHEWEFTGRITTLLLLLLFKVRHESSLKQPSHGLCPFRIF